MGRPGRLVGPMIALVLVACGPAPTLVLPSGAATSHAAREPALARAESTLAAAHGMTFAPAGPHHVVGTDRAGNQVDFIGVPVEEIVVTIGATDATTALTLADAYLPVARDLLGGTGSLWSWVRAELACRAASRGGCEEAIAQAGLSARFTDDGPDFWVVAISRDEPGGLLPRPPAGRRSPLPARRRGRRARPAPRLERAKQSPVRDTSR